MKPTENQERTMNTETKNKTPEQWEAYERRVQELEAEGMTRSDAQGCADAEEMTKENAITCSECGEEFLPDEIHWYTGKGTGIRFHEMNSKERENVSSWDLHCELCEEDGREKASA